MQKLKGQLNTNLELFFSCTKSSKITKTTILLKVILGLLKRSSGDSQKQKKILNGVDKNISTFFSRSVGFGLELKLHWQGSATDGATLSSFTSNLLFLKLCTLGFLNRYIVIKRV